MPVVRTDGRSVGCTVTRLPNIYRMGDGLLDGSWVDYHIFLDMGLRSCAWSLAIRQKDNSLENITWSELEKKVSSLAVVAQTDCMMIGRGIEFSQGHAAKSQPMAVRNIITKQFIIIPCTQIYLFSCYQNMKY